MILVTGGSGFLGSHIVHYLASQGMRVMATDLTEPSPPVQALWEPYGSLIQFTATDILNQEALEQLMARNVVDCVVHTATITPSPLQELTEPERILQTGIMGTSMVFFAAIRHGVQRFVYLSSASLYEPIADPKVVLHEDAKQRKQGIYPLTKAAGEWITRQCTLYPGVTAVSARIAACYGPLERNTGTRTMMSPVYEMIKCAKQGSPIVLVTPDHVVDYTYAYDIAQGIALLTTSSTLNHEVYNVSCGKGVTYMEIAEQIAVLIPGTEVILTSKNELGAISATPSSRVGSLGIDRLSCDTDFIPRYDLHAGLKHYLQWLEHHDY
jgi:UDP-glucose 4-epimerase